MLTHTGCSACLPKPKPPHRCAGFAAVMEAMRDCGKPMVGHNLAFDLGYSLHSFAQVRWESSPAPCMCRWVGKLD